jgi:hypothetical protein
MRTRFLLLGLLALSASAVWLLQRSAAETPVEERAAEEQPTDDAAAKPVDWQDDPVCQMVFFAVLEGLYTDGVPDGVVDSLIPPARNAPKNSDPSNGALRTSFVAQCPLCHPVYEALSLYQRRGAFQGDKSGRDTFGDGVTAELKEQLVSKDRRTRLVALRELVHRWVDRRLTLMRLSAEEQSEWTKKLQERSNQGKAFLSKLMKDDPDYQEGWSLYWGCAACNGTTDACEGLGNPIKAR